MNKKIYYYNQNADQFFDTTYQVDMTGLYQSFLRYLPEHASILDLGCGSGRDTLAFKNLGHQVEAIDYSEALVAKARQLTGLPVQLDSFYELSVQEKYEGIWACASLLHCEREKLSDVLDRILTALKPNGVCYISFKYGNQDREKDGRSFTLLS
ncbi:SAM-dependent methyltransferase [Acinetobacter sp. ACNIH2]|uniref:class I SAM-dependent methyltransferase n=1 Tax=Acinetobacter sp. ACNIH2 TaxID=1758189 RepID=UPI000CDC29F4|nr:class I SAM-dependent methyltransferase [Acinetobacter sp. ACNIH2]AUX85973.1 SAM-dependent methyltransferase [Acinetobacter sp. ACNIH2]